VLSQLETHFKAYRNIPKVVELLNNLHLIQSELRKQILELFDTSFTTNGQLQPSINAQQLSEACMVLENVDINAKQQLQDWYISLVLREYRTIFNSKEELASLLHVHRRFSWLKRFLKMYDEEHKAVFPSHWNMDYLVCVKFGEETKSGLLEVAPAVKDAKLLLRTLKTCIEFETAVVSRFPTISTEFSVISSAFEGQMSVYIEAEDKNLNDLLMKLKLAPLLSDETNQSVLSSSTALFIAYKELVAQFSKLGKGKLLVDLCELVGKYLVKYAGFLEEQVREERKGMTSMDWKNSCLILNTCHYCLSITQQLQDKLADMTTSSYKASITLESQIDLFKSTSMQTVKFLVKSLECSCEPVWNGILKTQWATLTSAGDQSPYVLQFNKIITEIISILSESINEPSLFKSFCDKFADAIPSHIYQCILKAKPILEIGAEQLLLDVHAIKQICLKVPSMTSNDAQPTSMFLKVLNKGFHKIEILLKVLLSPAIPPDALVHCFMNVYPPEEIKKQHFQLLLELKGLRKNEMAQLLGLFVVQAAARKIPTTPVPSETNNTSQVKRIFSFSAVK
ncbi:Vacuolar protein sorting-associated protein 53, partial [Coelomomyces lativittatus]